MMPQVRLTAAEVVNLDFIIQKDDGSAEDLSGLTSALLTVKEELSSTTAAFTASTTGASGNLITFSSVTVSSTAGRYLGQLKASFTGGNVVRSEPFLVIIDSKLD